MGTKRTLALFMIVTTSLTLACTSTEEGAQKVSGYDRTHKFRSATLLPDGTMCTEIFTEGDQYAADCNKAGFKAYRIECHEYLCSGNLP